jgi:tetratricopeptide (TPR) repeat protein
VPGFSKRAGAVAAITQLTDSFNALMAEDRYEDARAAAQAASELALDDLGPDRPEYATALARVGIAAEAAGDLESAERAYSSALDAAI